jgi:hypothetical protein
LSELDHSLRRIADLPVPASLELVDDAVFAGLAALRHERTASRRAIGLAGAFALVLGLGSGGLATAHAAQVRISSFASDNPLAPSTLLDVHP